MKITGKFIGNDSCGFENGRIYNLYFHLMMSNKNPMKIMVRCLTSECEYDSLYLFLQNWEVLK
jgi:hypothetical protein